VAVSLPAESCKLDSFVLAPSKPGLASLMCIFLTPGRSNWRSNDANLISRLIVRLNTRHIVAFIIFVLGVMRSIMSGWSWGRDV
jgi:hypothetical protein